MKRLFVVVLLAGQSVWGQNPTPDLSWTFQWGTNASGVVFEDTSLTASVKAAIRDDIKRVYQFNPQSNATFRLYVLGDEEHGKYTGTFGFEKTTACPNEIRGLDYCVYGGTNFYAVTESISSAYAEKIALTNQHPMIMGSLSNFLHTANHVTVGKTTPTEFVPMWWLLKKGRVAELADDTPEGLQEGIQSMSEARHYCLSLLSLWEKPPSDWGVPSEKPLVVGCTVTTVSKTDGYKIDMEAVYKKGKWRFVAWE